MKLKHLMMAAIIGCTSTVAFADGPTFVGKGEGKDVTGDGIEYPFTINYTIVYNENKTLTVSGELNWGDNGPTPGSAGDFHIYFPDGNYDFTQSPITTTQTYELNDNVKIEFWKACSVGRTQIVVQYVVGSESDGSGEGGNGGETPEQPEQPEQPVGGATYIGHATGVDIIHTENGDEEYPYTLDYTITYNDNKTLTILPSYIWENGEPTGSVNPIYVYFPEGNIELKSYGDAVTTEQTYEKNEVVRIRFTKARALGSTETWIDYVVGSEGEEANIKIAASVDNITFNSAEITYTVTAPEGLEYTVYYKSADREEFAPASESPIKLENLKDHSSYSYELYAVAVAEEDGKQIESNHVTVTFKTPSESAIAYVYNDILNAEFVNTHLIGEDNSSNRNFLVALPWSIIYDVDGTAKYTIDLTAAANIDGLVPQLWIDGPFVKLQRKENSNIWEYSFGEQTYESSSRISHFIAYAGGVVDRPTNYTQWGLEKEAVTLGEPAKLELIAEKTVVNVEDIIPVKTILTDANGYYLPIDKVEYGIHESTSMVNDKWNLNYYFQPTGYRGLHVLYASYDEYNLSAKVEFNVIASKESSDVIKGTEGVTNQDNVSGGSVADVTDGNVNSQLEWSRENQNNYLIYDLGDDYYIETIYLLYEGAYASKFTVTLSNQAPAELGNGISLMAAGNDVVFTPSEGSTTEHYFMHDPSTTHRYVTLRTSEAGLNNDYGIKLKEMQVYASTTQPSTPTDVKELVIDNVDNSNAPVEFFNLNGQRVNNPAGGIFIRRQGTNVSKVIIR